MLGPLCPNPWKICWWHIQIIKDEYEHDNFKYCLYKESFEILTLFAIKIKKAVTWQICICLLYESHLDCSFLSCDSSSLSFCRRFISKRNLSFFAFIHNNIISEVILIHPIAKFPAIIRIVFTNSNLTQTLYSVLPHSVFLTRFLTEVTEKFLRRFS